MPFCNRKRLDDAFKSKTVAIVGSGPSGLLNRQGFIDSHQVVVRVNNYKLIGGLGRRCDVFYSYFGKSIRKKKSELFRDGVNLCISKCPNSKFIESEWHTKNRKESGVDFRSIYEYRHDWWFCDTYIPTNDEFLEKFNLLGGHIPTTGFSALLDVLKFNPARVYMTGFDFFTSNIHNVNERWRAGYQDDPIKHEPEVEARWIRDARERYPITMDLKMKEILDAL
jgi:hypothetical protein